MVETKTQNQDINQAGACAGVQATTEVGLGSFLHAYHVPFSGHLLSLNQGLLLSHFTRKGQSPFHVALWSTLATGSLKALSPMGKRLTPMVAITTQGILFATCLKLLGNNLIARILGITLLSLWAFIQPLALYLLIFGKEIIDVVTYFRGKLSVVTPITNHDLLIALAIVVAVKVLLGIGLILVTYRWTDEQFQKYQTQLQKHSRKSTLPIEPLNTQTAEPLNFRQRLLIATKDLLKPWFLLSLAILLFFFVATNASLISSTWILLRTIGIALIVFYILRFAPIEGLLAKSQNKGPVFEVISIALKRIRQL